VASKGDILQFRSKKAGETAEVFNHLAKGLTALAHQPGGVTAFGRHWCVDHQQCLDAQAGIHREPTPDHNPDEPDEDDQPTYRGRPVTTITTQHGVL
jgi:hypothetical protein